MHLYDLHELDCTVTALMNIQYTICMIYIILEESGITHIVCIVQYASVNPCGRYMYMTVLFTELRLTPRKPSPYRLIVDKSQI